MSHMAEMIDDEREDQSRWEMLEAIEPEEPEDVGQVFYIHKHEIQLQHGGSEEGGWWFTAGQPVPIDEWNPSEHEFQSKKTAVVRCWELNEDENERRHKEEQYEYHSVLAYRSTFYQYDINNSPEPYWFPSEKPHYE